MYFLQANSYMPWDHLSYFIYVHVHAYTSKLDVAQIHVYMYIPYPVNSSQNV